MNSTAQESAFYFSNLFNTAILKQSNPNAKINIKLDPFPLTQSFKSWNASADIILYIVIGVVFIPGMTAGFIVYEREKEVKH
jgi:hypothetical protein